MEENKNKPKLDHNTRNTTFAATRARIPLCVHESRLFVHESQLFVHMACSIYGSRTIDSTFFEGIHPFFMEFPFSLIFLYFYLGYKMRLTK